MSYEARVGAVIVLAVVIFFFGVLYLREYTFAKKEYEITAKFETVVGLELQDPVIISGYKIGQVKEMQLVDDSVEVRLFLDSRYQLARDSKAILRNLTLLGDKAIEVVKGKSKEMLQAGEKIPGQLETDFFDLAEAAAPIGEDITVLLKRFRSTFDENTEASLKGSLRNLNTISGAVAVGITENLGEVELALKSLKIAAKNFEQLTAPEGKSMHDVIANLDSSATSLKAATMRLSNAANSMEKVLGKVEKGEGSLGRLIHDDTLYRNLEKFTQDLDLLILDVKQHPQKYIKIEVF